MIPGDRITCIFLGLNICKDADALMLGRSGSEDTSFLYLFYIKKVNEHNERPTDVCK